MRIDPRWAHLVIGSKVGAGVQGETGAERLMQIVDPVLVLDESLHFYGPTLGNRMWVRIYHDSSNWKDPQLWAQHCAIQGEKAYQHGCRNLIMCNEQIAVEGLGQSEEDYRWLNRWGIVATLSLKDRLAQIGCPDMRIWGPALSPGHQEDDGIVGYRMLAEWLGCLDGIAVHCYWTPNNGSLTDWDAEWWSRRIERAYAVVYGDLGIQKPWAVTEFNRKVDRDSGGDILNYAEQTKDYYRYLNALPYVVAGFTFLYCRRDPAFADLSWADMPRMLDYMSDGWDRKAELPGIEVPEEPEPKPEEPEGTMAYTTIGNGYRVIDRRADLPKNGEYDERPLAGVKYIVIHHSAVTGDQSAETLASYHVQQGWPGIGYAFVVHPDGRTEYCQDMGRASYHVAGRNYECLGICLPGDFTSTPPSQAQLAATRRLVAEVQFSFGWFLPVVGHGQIALPGYPTNCPGATFAQWKAQVEVLPSAPSIPPASGFGFILGFRALADRLGLAVVGEPLENEHRATVTIQRTTQGLMLWQEGEPSRFYKEAT